MFQDRFKKVQVGSKVLSTTVQTSHQTFTQLQTLTLAGHCCPPPSMGMDSFNVGLISKGHQWPFQRGVLILKDLVHQWSFL